VRLAEASKAFERHLPQARKRVLVAGDSSGVGTGAGHPSETVAGRIARELRDVEVVNVSRAGARAPDVLGQVASVNGSFDVVLIQAGQDDVLFFTGEGTVHAAFSQALCLASRKAEAVILMSSANVGLAPAFFPPLSMVYSRRTMKLREMLVLLCRETGTEFVDLYRTRSEEPLLKDPGRYFAADRLHPGSEGYAVWYEELKRQSSLVEALKDR
jgi:lysophospholipase L1-like esterase